MRNPFKRNPITARNALGIEQISYDAIERALSEPLHSDPVPDDTTPVTAADYNWEVMEPGELGPVIKGTIHPAQSEPIYIKEDNTLMTDPEFHLAKTREIIAALTDEGEKLNQLLQSEHGRHDSAIEDEQERHVSEVARLQGLLDDTRTTRRAYLSAETILTGEPVPIDMPGIAPAPGDYTPEQVAIMTRKIGGGTGPGGYGIIGNPEGIANKRRKKTTVGDCQSGTSIPVQKQILPESKE